MSRCFPFPPPGYVKARADEENLLNKEKQKEKKHKKEKKDKEKREGKEKKEKERSKEKHKGKKERKDKHKDKKDKHKDKDNERKSVSNERDNAQPQEHVIAEKLGPSSFQSAQSNDTKFLLELGKRIGKDGEPSAEKNLLVHKLTLTGQGNSEIPGKDKGEEQRKVNGRQNGVVSANGFIQKFEGVHRRTLKGVGGVLESSAEKQTNPEENNKQTNYRCKGGEQKERDPEKKIGVGLLVEKPIEKQTELEERKKQKNGEGNAGKHKDRDPERKSKSKDKERDKQQRKDERKKEKRKEKELKKEQLKQIESGKPAADGDNMKTTSNLEKERSGGEGNVRKRKELETNGFLHDTGIRQSKLLRPVSASHQIVENGRINEPCKTAIRLVDDLNGNKKILSSPSFTGHERILESLPKLVSSTHQIMVNGRKPEPLKTASQIVAELGEGNKKVATSLSLAGNGNILEPYPKPKSAICTKELVVNGRKKEIIAEGEGNSKKGLEAKMEPLTPALPAPENGRKIEVSRRVDQSASDRDTVVINQKVDDKEIRVNGQKRPSSCSKQVKEMVKPKPPHPDSKLLDTILSIPKVEWSDFDDQEWLFGCSSNLPQKKRSKVGGSSPCVEGTTKQHVWAEALPLEFADIVALPYVIPY